MTSNGYLAVKSHDLTLRLQALFQEYIDLNTQIHNTRINKDAMSDECIELSLKQKNVVREIGLIVKQIKLLQSGTSNARNLQKKSLGSSSR